MNSIWKGRLAEALALTRQPNECPSGWRRVMARKSIATYVAESERGERSEMPRQFGPTSLTLLGYGWGRLLPLGFTWLNRHARVPWFRIAIATVAAALLGALVPTMALVEVLSVGTLMAFAVVCGSVAYLRRAQPQALRPFRVPFWPITTSIGVISCVYMLSQVGVLGLARVAVWMILGLVVYFGYSVRT